MQTKNPSPVALTIAGLDPSGGAGVLADVRTFTAFNVRATAAITSVTFQNTFRVFGASHISAEDVKAQVLPILEEFKITGAKTGMLPTSETIREVARLFKEIQLPGPVVDPVMVSTSGHSLIEDEAVEVLVHELIPLARVVTPNIPEAERLTSIRISDVAGMQRAAIEICNLGARAVLIKGGHLPKLEPNTESEAIDVLYEDGDFKVFRSEYVRNAVDHGTGCRLSAAIAACLAQGMALEDSVQAAKTFVTGELRASASSLNLQS